MDATQYKQTETQMEFDLNWDTNGVSPNTYLYAGIQTSGLLDVVNKINIW